MTGKDERPNLYDYDPDERAYGWQPRARPPLRTASSLVVLELSPRSYHDDIDNTNQKGPGRTPNAQFRVSVRWAVLLSAAVLMVGVVGTGLFFCYGDGIHLGSLMSTEKSDTQKKDLLDKLNGISGSLVAAVLIPLELVVVMSMSVVCLCFATDWMLQRGVSDFVSSSMTTIVAGVVMYLLSNGFSALNVQLVSGDYHVKITAQDLAVSSSFIDDQAVAANGSLVTTWNASFAEKSENNSVLNTILRTKLIPFEDVQPTCHDPILQQSWRLRTPTLSFGFASRSWQLETLQTALAPERMIEFMLEDTSLPRDKELPMSTDNATLLTVAATQVLPDLLSPLWGGARLDYWGTEPEDDSEMQSAADVLNISANDYISTSTPVLRDLLHAGLNISSDGVRIAYKHLAISESVVIDALTLVIPTTPVVSDDYLLSSCSTDGCYAIENFFGEESISVQPGVYAAAVCINEDDTVDLRVGHDISSGVPKTCPHQSNTSMLLIGLGKQIVGPTWNYHMNDSFVQSGIDARNITMTYSVTVARISWVIDDLADAFSAECDSDGGCSGIRTPLDHSGRSSNDVLMVGEAALPLAQLDYFSVAHYDAGLKQFTNWKELVNLSPPVNYWSEGDLLLPRRFPVIAEGGDIRRVDQSFCDAYADKYIKVVEKNHLYAEESLQMTYTAGFFFLFQNAVQHSPVSNTTPSLLAFSGNTQELYIQASIPTVNIYVSICGCVVLLIMSVGVVIVQKKSTKTLEQAAKADIVAEALLNTTKYPRLFLDMALEDLTKLSSRTPLEELRIKIAEFARKQTKTETQAECNVSDFTFMSSPA